jgi:hypothetical protein
MLDPGLRLGACATKLQGPEALPDLGDEQAPTAKHTDVRTCDATMQIIRYWMLTCEGKIERKSAPRRVNSERARR